MNYLLLLIFLGIPITEIALFILIGQHIGLAATIAAIVLTAVAGAALVRHQGLATLARARTELAQDRLPVGALGEGLAILIAGALLLTPGFLTDTIGFMLLVPQLRRALISAIAGWLGPHIVTSPVHSGGRRAGSPGMVIEGEAVEIDEERPQRSEPTHSPWRGDR